MKLSIIIPVYNRPAETRELLQSLTLQTDRDFEVIVVEDGSTDPSRDVTDDFREQLDIGYYFKENTGPGPSRNFGSAKAHGDYLIFLDSDCVLPQEYVHRVRESLQRDYADAFGGPDRAHADFTTFQKAINFSMTSFLTTGGIRGGTERMGKFHPRSFNMGISTKVFEATGGFSSMRFGEDVDLSIRILEQGFRTRLIKEAFVYHKRRSTLRQFFKQVFNSGMARIHLSLRHPGTLKWVHALPALFTLGAPVLVLLALVASWYFVLPLALHLVLLFLSSTWNTRSLSTGLLSVLTSYTQLFAYGTGFLYAFFLSRILGRGESSAFKQNFYR